MNSAITVNQLYAILRNCIKNGNGGKKILISDDDEGNGYHELFFGITPSKDIISMVGANLPFNVTEEDAINNYVILG